MLNKLCLKSQFFNFEYENITDLAKCQNVATTSSGHVAYNALDTPLTTEFEFYTISTDSGFSVRLSEHPYLPGEATSFFIDFCNSRLFFIVDRLNQQY